MFPVVHKRYTTQTYKFDNKLTMKQHKVEKDRSMSEDNEHVGQDGLP